MGSASGLLRAGVLKATRPLNRAALSPVSRAASSARCWRVTASSARASVMRRFSWAATKVALAASAFLGGRSGGRAPAGRGPSSGWGWCRTRGSPRWSRDLPRSSARTSRRTHHPTAGLRKHLRPTQVPVSRHVRCGPSPGHCMALVCAEMGAHSAQPPLLTRGVPGSAGRVLLAALRARACHPRRLRSLAGSHHQRQPTPRVLLVAVGPGGRRPDRSPAGGLGLGACGLGLGLLGCPALPASSVAVGFARPALPPPGAGPNVQVGLVREVVQPSTTQVGLGPRRAAAGPAVLTLARTPELTAGAALDPDVGRVVEEVQLPPARRHVPPPAWAWTALMVGPVPPAGGATPSAARVRQLSGDKARS